MCKPRLATLLNVHYRLSSKNIVFASARTHCIIYANPVFLKRIGRSEKEFRTKAFLDFVHPEDKGPTLDQMAKLADGDPTVMFTNRYLKSNGSYINVTWTAAIIDGWYVCEAETDE